MIQMFKISCCFRFLIGLERRIKIADTSPNTILLLELVELNTRIIMRKMRVLSNLLTPLGPCDPCMGVAGSSVGGVATLEADSSKTQDGVLRGLWKPKICKFWVKPKRTKKGMWRRKPRRTISDLGFALRWPVFILAFFGFPTRRFFYYYKTKNAIFSVFLDFKKKRYRETWSYLKSFVFLWTNAYQLQRVIFWWK